MELLCSQASQVLAGELNEVAGERAPHFIHMPWGYRCTCTFTSVEAAVTEPGSAVSLKTVYSQRDCLMSAWRCPDANLGGSTNGLRMFISVFCLLSSLSICVKVSSPLQNLQPFSLLPYFPHLEETGERKRGGQGKRFF